MAARSRSDVLTPENIAHAFKLIDKVRSFLEKIKLNAYIKDKDGVISKDDLQKTFDKTRRFKDEDMFTEMLESALGQMGYGQVKALLIHSLIFKQA